MQHASDVLHAVIADFNSQIMTWSAFEGDELVRFMTATVSFGVPVGRQAWRVVRYFHNRLALAAGD